MSMTKKQIDLSKKFYDGLVDIIMEYNSDMAKEADTEKGVPLGDIFKISVSTKATMDTVFLSITKSLMGNMSEDMSKPEIAEKLLVDIVAESTNSYMCEIMPMVLGSEVSDRIVQAALVYRIESAKSQMDEVNKLGEKLKNIDPSKSFEEIITEAKDAKRTH